MQNLWWKLFPPLEVKAALEAARAIFAESSACRPIIEPAVKKVITQDIGRTLKAIRDDGKKADLLAFIVLQRVLAGCLSSGEFHVYRGLLGAVGGEMLTLFHKVQNAMLAKGYCTDEEARERTRWVQESIKAAG